MEDNTKKKISRRDAMKLLAVAVGAATVANLPSEWNKPALAASQLPEHAKQSAGILTVRADGPTVHNTCQSQVVHATVSPLTANIPLRYEVVSNPPGGVTLPSPATGIVNTDASGVATLIVQGDDLVVTAGDTITITWSFVNVSDGTGTSSQVLTVENSGC